MLFHLENLNESSPLPALNPTRSLVPAGRPATVLSGLCRECREVRYTRLYRCVRNVGKCDTRLYRCVRDVEKRDTHASIDVFKLSRSATLTGPRTGQSRARTLRTGTRRATQHGRVGDPLQTASGSRRCETIRGTHAGGRGDRYGRRPRGVIEYCGSTKHICRDCLLECLSPGIRAWSQMGLVGVNSVANHLAHGGCDRSQMDPWDGVRHRE